MTCYVRLSVFEISEPIQWIVGIQQRRVIAACLTELHKYKAMALNLVTGKLLKSKANILHNIEKELSLRKRVEYESVHNSASVFISVNKK